MPESSPPKRSALVCLLPGLGDALAASNLLRRLYESGYAIDVMTMLGPVAEYARALDIVRNVYNLPLLSKPLQSVPQLLRLRANRYDLCAVPFPATRWQYAFVAYVVAARQTVMHDYGGLSSVLSRLARATSVKLRGGHRFWENERLADAAALSPDRGSGYLVPESWRSSAVRGSLGVHTGTMIYKGNEARRWPFERFVELIAMQHDAGRRIRIFVGPNELEDENQLRAALRGRDIEVVKAPLNAAARALAECEVFVGNDAGFSHLAAGLGVKTVVVFGMTNPVRALPLGSASAVRPSACPPCHDEGLRGFECVRALNFRCLNEDLPVALVSERVDRMFESDKVVQEIDETGSFSLYGKRFIDA